MSEAEMRYIDNQLWEFIQKFQELTDGDSARESQRKLAQRLNNMPLGLILETPKKQEKKGFLKV